MRARSSTRLVTATAAASFGLSIYFVATGVSRLSESPSETLLDESSELQAAALAVSLPAPTELAQAVLQRNIFDSKQGPVAWEVEQPVAPAVGAATADVEIESGPPEPCDSPLRLLGSVVVARRPERSVAMLSWQGQSHVVQVGQALGDTQVLALRPARAYVQPAGKGVCMLALFKPASERATAAKVPVKKKPAKAKRVSKRFTREELDAAIRPDGPNHVRVARDFMESALTNPIKFAAGARFVPASRGGNRIGMRVYRVRRDSLLFRLGVRNGDVLRSINGVALSDADGLLRAYTSLRDQSELSLSLYRRGAVTSLGFGVR